MTFLRDITHALRSVPGVVGVVLGGSRATGTAHAGSDYDIGVYYDAVALDIPALQRVATAFDDADRSDSIAPPGAWGAWVNGGAWLTIGGEKVDVLLRDIHRVTQACADAAAGVVTMHYQPGHPHAYLNVMYAGELAVAQNLWEADGCLTRLRSTVTPYPAALRDALVGFFLFEAGFSLQLASTVSAGVDAFYIQAHISRSLAALHQVWCAQNRMFCLNEKGVVARIAGFPQRPTAYAERVQTICTQSELRQSITLLAALYAETQTLLAEPPVA